MTSIVWCEKHEAMKACGATKEMKAIATNFSCVFCYFMVCSMCPYTCQPNVIDDKLNLKKTTNERKTTSDAAKQCANFSISNFQLYRHLLFTFCFRCAIILIKASLHRTNHLHGIFHRFVLIFFYLYYTNGVVFSFCSVVLCFVVVAVCVVDFQRLATASSLVSLSMGFRVQRIRDGACLLKVYDALFNRSIEGKGVYAYQPNDFMKLNYEFICKRTTLHDICMCNQISNVKQ